MTKLGQTANIRQADVEWPDVFKTKNISGKSDAELCAIGLTAWGLVLLGNHFPDSFGDVLVMIGKKLGISSTPDSFMEYSKIILK